MSEKLQFVGHRKLSNIRIRSDGVGSTRSTSEVIKTLFDTRWPMFDFISNLRTFNLRNLNLRIFDLTVFTVRISTSTFQKFLIATTHRFARAAARESLLHRSTRSAVLEQ